MHLFESDPQATPYFHNVYVKVRTTDDHVDRKEEKVLFFGWPEEHLKEVTSPDRRCFLLKQEEIDQRAHVTDSNWMCFIDKWDIREENPFLGINHKAANTMMISNIDKDRDGRVEKWGTRLQLLERRPELDGLTPAEKEIVYTRVRADRSSTEQCKILNILSSFVSKRGSREEVRAQYEEMRERGMLSNREMKLLNAKGLLSEHRRPPGMRREQGPIATLYKEDRDVVQVV